LIVEVVTSAAVVPGTHPVIPLNVILFKIEPLLIKNIVAFALVVTPSSLKPDAA